MFATTLTLPDVTAMLTLLSLVNNAKVAPAIRLIQSAIVNNEDIIKFYFFIFRTY